MGLSNARSRRAILVTLFVGLPLSGVFLWLSIRGRPTSTPSGERWAARARCPSWQPSPSSARLVRLSGASVAPDRYCASLPHLGQVVEMLDPRGVAVNNVVPGRVGDLLRANWMARRADRFAWRAGTRIRRCLVIEAADLVVLAASLFLLPAARLPHRLGSIASPRRPQSSSSSFVGGPSQRTCINAGADTMVLGRAWVCLGGSPTIRSPDCPSRADGSTSADARS